MSYLVKLEYFKPSGKWYCSGEYISDMKTLYDIWNEIKYARDNGFLPGVGPSVGRDFLISVRVPNHKSDHPHLIVNNS